MANSFDWQVVLNIAMNGGPQTKRELDQLTRAQGELDKASVRTSESLKKQGDSAKSAGRGFSEAANHANSLRYANYDLATTLLSVSAGLTAVGAASLTAFASQESAFTSVERTADGALGNIRDRLTELSTVIPKSFNELAQIATLGNQLGIPAAQLEAFTKTVAEFSIATGISAEESALAFGKLGNLLGVLPKDYDRLASSIALVGRTTAATEKQIISVAGEIAPAAAAAGFTADQVVGLSGALASLKVPPERSRSTILQFFETLNNAVASGGDKLQSFASIVGVTASDLEQMVRAGQGEDILTRFIGNVSSSDTIEITQALQNLGLAGLRTNPTIRALAGNMTLLNQSLADGKTGYTENTELQRQMAFVLDDLSTKWTNFLNASTNAAAAVGSAVAPALGQLLDSLTELIVGFQEFASSDIGQMVTRMATGVLAGVAAWAALRGAIALATATTFAFNTATSFIGGKGILQGILGLAGAMGIYTAKTDAGTKASWNFANGLKAFGRATVVVGLLSLLGNAFLDFGGTVQNVGNFVIGMLVSIAVQAIEAARIVTNAFGGIPMFKDWSDSLRAASNSVTQWGRDVKASFGDWTKTLPRASDDAADFAGASEDAGIAASDWAAEMGDLGDATEQTAKKVRTLTDYTSDLQSVWDRAFQIRFDPQTTLDGIATKFQEMRDAAKETSQNIRQLQADLGLLNADLNTQRYFLGIAERYGDEKRAQALRAQIAKTQADIADKTADLNAEQQRNNRTLTGNTQAARDNRSTITGLVAQYQAHIAALSNSGLSTEELKRQTEQLRQDFINQATQLGFNRSELDLYTVAFRDVKVAIDNVPRGITVTANIDPALQALNEFVAKAKEAGTQAGTGLGEGFGTGFGTGLSNAEAQAKAQATQFGQAISRELSEQMSANQYAPIFTGIPRSSSGSRSRPGGGFFADGGYTGAGGKYEPAGIVHRGEYVIPKQYVNQATGLPHADALGRLQRGASGRRGYAGGGFVSGGGMSGHIASFGPMAAMQLAQALSTQFVFDSGAAAGAVNRQNARSSALSAG